MTHDASHSYTFDAENRVTAVDGGGTASYLYDPEGRRVQKTVGGAWRDYIYDTSGNVVAETVATGWNIGYVYALGQLVATYNNSTTYFVHKDHLGSARLLTKLDKTTLDSTDFLPFGEQIAGASGTSHKFTGDERDAETNLDHTWFRQYSSSLGRWMTPDPAGFAVADLNTPQSWNWYAYVFNDPLGLIDPSGLCGEGPVTSIGPDGTITISIGAACPPIDVFFFSSGGLWHPPMITLREWDDLHPRLKHILRIVTPILRSVGNYIPVVCGGGLFNYGSGLRATSEPVTVSANPKIRIADTRSGYSEGPFTDVTVGLPAGPQGGIGYAQFASGGSETFLFAGLGFKVKIGEASVSLSSDARDDDSPP